MRRSARTALLQGGWLASQAPTARRFRRIARDPQRTQEARLAELLGVLAPSAHGRALGLDRVSSADDFQRRTPITDYDHHRPWIDRVAAGEPGLLTTEPVEMVERTSGSGGAVKLVPYTSRLRREFATAVATWMVDLHRAHPGLAGTRQYWSVSRATRGPERTEGGLKIGFDDDAEYFGPITRRALRHLMAVPGEVARSESLEAWRRATATHLVEAGNLGLISVWSPSFLTRLVDWITEHGPTLEVSHAARHRLERALASGDFSALWPRLQVISAWGDGFAGGLVEPMMAPFPGVAFQAKGLLATEGVVSFPMVGHAGAVVAVDSHVLELRLPGTDRVFWPHEARLGERYQPLLTTGGGLVRYGLPDLVEVVDFVGRIPCVRLVGRIDRGSDMVGEKLTESVVADALRGLDLRGDFAMLVPRVDPLRYVLVVDRAPPTADAVDRALSLAVHYAYARGLEQLAPAEVRVVPDAWARWEAAIEASGGQLGDQKPGSLEVRQTVARHLLSA